MAPGERRRWWLVFGLLTLATSAWALVSPLMSGHDEAAHAVRAAAVARGHLWGRPAPEAFPPEPNVFIEVEAPEAHLLGAAVGCFNKHRERTPHCAPDFDGGRDIEWVLTYQFRSQPTYYAAVGWPSLVDPAAAGVYGMRLVSGALCAALLASAAMSTRLATRPRWTLLGLCVAITPEVLYLAGTINSNGIEVAAAIGAWTSLLAIARTEGPPPGRLITRAGAALVVLAGTRGLSPGFAAAIVALVALATPWERVVPLLRRRDVRAWAIATGAMAVLSLAYVEWVRRRLPIERPGQGLSTVAGDLGWYLRQGVGVFGSNDIPLPTLVYVIWGAAVLLTVVAVVATLSVRGSLVVLLAVCAGVGIQVGAEGFALPPIGFFWQGRYALPLLVGVPLLATSVVSEARRPWAALDRLIVPTMVLLVAAQLASFTQAARRFAVTLDGPANPLRFLFDPQWSPPTGPAPLYLLLFAVGLGGALVAVMGPERLLSSGPRSRSPR